MNRVTLFLVAALSCLVFASPLLAQEKITPQFAQPLVEPYLMSGQLTEGEAALLKHLEANPKDDQARFGLGVLQFLQGVEHLGKSLSQFQLQKNSQFLMDLPFLRFPVKASSEAKEVELKDIHAMLDEISKFMDKSEKTLAQIVSDDVELPLRIFQINLDYDGDGVLDAKDENFNRVIARYVERKAKNQRETVVLFDRADVEWLLGYTHLIRTMTEMIQAYDQSELWEVSAHRFFKNAKIKSDFLLEEMAAENKKKTRSWWDTHFIIDAIAGVHNMRFPLKDASRVKKAEQHFRAGMAHSRKMWVLIEAEKDNRNEWLPSPEQESAITKTRITETRLETWKEFLDEAEAILDGEKLIPFWRGKNPRRGLNLKKFFDNPSDIDVVLWAHGIAASDYLEEGDISAPATWRRFQQVFNGDFFGFAAWIN